VYLWKWVSKRKAVLVRELLQLGGFVNCSVVLGFVKAGNILSSLLLLKRWIL
jgi:hypothetical protein